MLISLEEAVSTVMRRRDRLERELQSSMARLFQAQRRKFKVTSYVRRASESSRWMMEVDSVTLINQLWPEMWRQAAAAIAQKAIPAAGLAGNITLAAIGFPEEFTIGKAVRERLTKGSLVAARSIDDTSKQIIRDIFARGQDLNWDHTRIGREIQATMKGWSKHRAQAVAQTEINEAWSSTQHEVLARNGWEARIWQTSQDELVCPICRGNADAGAVAINDAFPSGAMWPPGHPGKCRCNITAAVGHDPKITPIQGNKLSSSEQKAALSKLDDLEKVRGIYGREGEAVQARDVFRAGSGVGLGWTREPRASWWQEGTLDLSQIRYAQPTIPVAGIKAYIKNPPTALPEIGYYNGAFHVLGGHTRLAAQILAGRKQATVRVLEFKKGRDDYARPVKPQLRLERAPEVWAGDAGGVEVTIPKRHLDG